MYIVGKARNQNRIIENKVPSALSTPLLLTHEGIWGFSFVAFYCKMFLCIKRTSSKLFFLTTLNTSNMSFALATMFWIASTGCSMVMILLMGALFLAALIVVTLNLFPSPVKAASVLPVAICITRNGLCVCPVSSFPATTDIVSLQSPKNSAAFFLRTTHSLTACSIRSGMSSCVCSSILTGPNILLLVLSASSIPLEGI